MKINNITGIIYQSFTDHWSPLVQVFSLSSQQDSQYCFNLFSLFEQKFRKSCIIFFWNNSSPVADVESDFHFLLTMWFQDHKNPTCVRNIYKI